MRILQSTLAAIVILGLGHRAAAAAAISGGAFEPFDYVSSPAPTNQIIAANNLNGGFGWNAGGDSSPNAATANWENAATLPAPTGATASRTISAGSLSYPAVGYPASTGNRATLVGSGGTNNSVARSLGQLVDSGTFYFSYLTKRNEDTMRTTSLAFFGPANGIAGTPGNQPERFAIGQIGTPTAGSGSTFGDIGALMNNVNTSTTNNILYGANPVAYGTGVTHLIAGRIDFNPTGPDTLRLYVDPQDVTAEPATPYIQSSAYELSSFNSVRLFAGNAATLGGVPNVAASTDFDEIRFGSTWKDVVASAPHPAKYKFTTIDYPGATITAANNIDGAGRIVGEYEDPSGHHAFILDDGVYSSFDVPGAFGASSANGLNAADQVVGWYDGFVTTKAYIRNGATYTDLNPFAGAPDVKAYAINEAGHVAGYYERPTDGLYRGYVYDGTNYTTLNYPGAVGSQAIGINKDDDLVGYYFSGQPHGFLYVDGAYTTVDHPNGGFGTVAQGINDAGEIAGIYFDSNNRDHGFIKTSTGFVTVDYPGAALTGLTAINNAGQVVGYYGDGFNPFRAFVATPLAAADFNGDDKVDGADLARWKSGLGTASVASKRDGDADGDGDVDGGDFLLWQRLVTSATIAASAEAAVPEPASIALAVSCLGLAEARRRRQPRRQG